MYIDFTYIIMKKVLMLSFCKDVTCSLQFNHLSQEILITASREFLEKSTKVSEKAQNERGEKRGRVNSMLIFGEYLFCSFFQLSSLTLLLGR